MKVKAPAIAQKGVVVTEDSCGSAGKKAAKFLTDEFNLWSTTRTCRDAQRLQTLSPLASLALHHCSFDVLASAIGARGMTARVCVATLPVCGLGTAVSLATNVVKAARVSGKNIADSVNSEGAGFVNTALEFSQEIGGPGSSGGAGPAVCWS